jgi:multimeric flavodoxin WrbA
MVAFMKILGIVCSPREGGNTEILVREALEGARDAGGEPELVLLAGKEIAPCDACSGCENDGQCIVEDDMQDIYEKLESADGLIFGTPVYFLNVSAQAKAVMDRTFGFLRTRKLKGKVAAAIVVARRVGAGQVLSLLYTFFAIHRMVIAGGGIGYGREKGEVREGPGGSPEVTALQEARAVGKNVVKMARRLGT